MAQHSIWGSEEALRLANLLYSHAAVTLNVLFSVCSCFLFGNIFCILVVIKLRGHLAGDGCE